MGSKYEGVRFYSDEDTRKIADEIEMAVTIPVNTEIAAEHRVYDQTEMKEILEQADKIAVQDCGCKTEYSNCDAPRDVCLSVNKEADLLVEKGLHGARLITVEEALDVLRRSHEAGLVHMAYTMKGEDKPGLICSCCPCCCHTLGSLVRNGVHTQILTSRYIAEDDMAKCDDCGDCVDRCVFQARRMEGGKLVYDETRCFGCGLCVSKCPTEAIRLVPRNAAG
ncbi:4Fe-4S binding protein [Candidatus Bathyarchaeota archaeon]|nr:4Fe-4S binding protein [Candidatus Bathyarchaeota archaeon]